MKKAYFSLLSLMIMIPAVALANPIPVGISYSLPESWIIATLLIVPGILIEILVALIYLAIINKPKRLAFTVFTVNMISMPLTWYLLSAKLPFWGDIEVSTLITMSWLGVLIYELLIVVFEALLVSIAVNKKLLFMEVLRMSFFCNLASFLVGLAVIYKILMILKAPTMIY
ncbi:MAG: hypothetical protein V1905_03000 [bacterium]